MVNKFSYRTMLKRCTIVHNESYIAQKLKLYQLTPLSPI